MDHKLTVSPIGFVHCGQEGFYIQLDQPYRKALAGLEGFDHLNVLWWFSGCDDLVSRARREERKPYVHGPDCLGTFATRAPERPNPIALSCAYVTHLDVERGVVGLAYLDAEEGSPVLDLKPYIPSLDRVERPGVPRWCAHWPGCVEESGQFDWGMEFNF